MPPLHAWPELQPLAQRIATGELDGDEAIEAIVEAIVARELQPHAPPAVVQAVRREALAAVHGDRVLVAMLRPVLSPTADMAHAVGQLGRAPAPGARARAVAAVDDALDDDLDAELAPRRQGRGRGSSPEAAARETAGFEQAQASRRITAIVGVAAGVLAGVAAWFLLLRQTPCERFARAVCFELAAPCAAADVEEHLRAKSVDADTCTTTLANAAEAAEAAGASKRGAAYERAVFDGLGFDPRTGEPPPPPAVEQVRGPVAPVMLARKLPPLLALVADEAYVYVSSGEAVLRLRSVGGQFEPLANAAAARDVAVTTDFVYWVAKGPDGVESIWVDRKRGEYEPTVVPTAPAKLGAVACTQGRCAYVDLTDGAVWTVAQDGSAATKLSGGLSPAPTSVWLDAEEVAWTVPGAVAAMPVAGGTARVVAGAESDPHGLLGDAEGLAWISGGALRYVARKGGDVQSLVPSGVTAIAIDGTRAYAAKAGEGVIVAAPRAGGEVASIATGQSNLDRLVVDAAALYWTAGAELYRSPK